jgi:RNA polymerase sigma factor (sigma-70 family)
MPEPTLRQFIRRFSARQRPPACESSDDELLREFVEGRDRAAFERLVGRHGPMVWGVCRGLLRHEQDVEDAFQATFLVLANRASAVRQGASLAGWLYAVARRTALAASALRRCELRGEDRPEPQAAGPNPASAAASAEACAAILAEVEWLPEQYRLPLILCGLQGLSRPEAARRLGWKEGTVAGRLARARVQLAARLARRGLGAAAVGVLSVVFQASASARPLVAVRSVLVRGR